MSAAARRLSATLSHLYPAPVSVPPTSVNMAQRTKVVVTRQLIDEAQRLLDTNTDLEIVQWHSSNVAIPPQDVVYLGTQR